MNWFDDFELEMEMESPWVYNDFLGFEVPTLELHTYLNIPDWNIDMEIILKYEFFDLNITVKNFIEEDDTWSEETNEITQILEIMGGAMSIAGAVFSVVGLIITLGEPTTGAVAIIGGVVGFIAAILGFITGVLIPLSENQMLEEAYWGFGFGLLVSTIVIFKPTGFVEKAGNFLGKVLFKVVDDLDFKVSSLFNNILKGVGAFFPTSIVKPVVSLLTGIISLLTGAVAITAAWNDAYKKIAQFSLGIICLTLSIYFIGQAIATTISNKIPPPEE